MNIFESSSTNAASVLPSLWNKNEIFKEVNPEKLRIVVASEYATLMSDEKVLQMMETFYDCGLAVIEFEKPTSPNVVRENLSSLSHFFGRMLTHKHAKGGIVDITTAPGIYKVDGIKRPQNDNGEQSPHTDGAFGEAPPIIALGCYRSAMIGGESTYVDMKNVFEHLWQRDIQALAGLFLPNAATVIRGDQQKKGPIFSFINNSVQACYSNHEYNTAEIGQASNDGFLLLDDYIKREQNQFSIPTKPGSITLFDNMRFLHGRKSFTDKKDEERWLMRAWYDGNTKTLENYQQGFKVNL